MTLPRINPGDVQSLVSGVSEVALLGTGGQKKVFSCKINGDPYVIKFILVGSVKGEDEENESIDFREDKIKRAIREVEVLGECNSPYLVKLGPIRIETVVHNEESLIYFSEEYIEGKNLKKIYEENPILSSENVLTLGRNITAAIRELSERSIIHRDIKPQNIIQRDTNGDYVLLDMGVALDLDDSSITNFGGIVGSLGYMSPEQLSYSTIRQSDFRSDFFCLGIVMYESITHQHPFKIRGESNLEDLAESIVNYNPPAPSYYNPALSAEIDTLILRLLTKSAHTRFRTCDMLDHALHILQTMKQGN